MLWSKPLFCNSHYTFRVIFLLEREAPHWCFWGCFYALHFFSEGWGFLVFISKHFPISLAQISCPYRRYASPSVMLSPPTFTMGTVCSGLYVVLTNHYACRSKVTFYHTWPSKFFHMLDVNLWLVVNETSWGFVIFLKS